MPKKKSAQPGQLSSDAVAALRAARNPSLAGKPTDVPSVPLAWEFQPHGLPDIAPPPEIPSEENPIPLSVQGPQAGLIPRIVREELVDAMIAWIQDYFTKLERAKAPTVMLVQVAKTFTEIETLKKDLLCLERSIELVGRENAQVLIDHAGEIRSKIIALYEQVASGS